jgi:hypothetical protein
MLLSYILKDISASTEYATLLTSFKSLGPNVVLTEYIWETKETADSEHRRLWYERKIKEKSRKEIGKRESSVGGGRKLDVCPVKLDIVCTGSTTASRPVKSYTACGVY